MSDSPRSWQTNLSIMRRNPRIQMLYQSAMKSKGVNVMTETERNVILDDLIHRYWRAEDEKGYKQKQELKRTKAEVRRGPAHRWLDGEIRKVAVAE